MMSTKVEIDWFNAKEDFSLWRQQMRAILVQMKVVKALKGEYQLPTDLSATKKEDIKELAYNTIISHLCDRDLREVSKETTSAGVWAKFEHLNMTKTLTNKFI